jgi:hypothetical protein
LYGGCSWIFQQALWAPDESGRRFFGNNCIALRPSWSLAMKNKFQLGARLTKRHSNEPKPQPIGIYQKILLFLKNT